MSTTIDATHDLQRRSWVESANGHAEFPIQNLPLGIFSTPGLDKRAGVAIGDAILDLKAAIAAQLLPEDAAPLLAGDTLNALLGAPSTRAALRQRVSMLLSDGTRRHAVEPLLHPIADCTLHLPAAIGDYTDFYAGIHHAVNVGRQFRPDNPLLPNYKYVPIGYHGRASSIRPSGVEVIRPHGQRKPPQSEVPVFGPTQRLDYELELGIWIGPGNELGRSVPIGRAGEHIAGLCLLNDWSARELQAWEYQPLGPFLAKNFHTTISPWVVTAEALAPFRIAQPARPAGDPQPLPYLWDEADQRAGAFSIALRVELTTAAMRATAMAPVSLSLSRADAMYWTAAQMVAHHASGGCDLRPGDLLGSGTLSIEDASGLGSLLELTQGGKLPIELPNGERRTFLEDGDEVTFSGHANAEGFVPIGFGTARARIAAARP
ncbi:MAG TPA: fumarylacetoacetase [Stellaceae bacterium]|jgi:fumarylacetoacetase|nr:fumarylacetoacetase [Stellaceae bacterium]